MASNWQKAAKLRAEAYKKGLQKAAARTKERRKKRKMKKLNSSYPYQKQLKNRSSKDLHWLVGPGTKDILRCVSGLQLEKWAAQEVRGVHKELERRAAKKDAKAGA